MIDEPLQTQAALYALGALPAGEATAFRAQLFENSELAALVAEYEEAAAAFAHTAPAKTPPPQLRAGILAAVKPKRAPVESTRTTWIPWALAAGFAIAAGLSWMQKAFLNSSLIVAKSREIQLHAELQARDGELQEIRKRATQGIATLSKQLLALKASNAGKAIEIEGLKKAVEELENRNAIAETQVATLTSKLDASYLASIAWDTASQEGVLHVRRLPDIGAGKDYQLWVIDPKYKVPVSAGIFKVQPDGSATIRFAPNQRISQAAAFAVSVEKTGGSSAPEGPIVLSN